MDSLHITTSIPYVNGLPHVGFALELVQADALARYHRLRGRSVRFQTGTDEHAQKNVLAARALGVPTRELVDRNAAAFAGLLPALEVAADDFVRTTEPRHRAAVEAFWRRLRRGDLYVQPYRGLYCSGCEDFYQASELRDGACPEHGVPPVAVEEQNVFFRLSAYQAPLERLIEAGVLRITLEARRREVWAFVRSGLRDFSVSRSAARSNGWGIPVPQDASQVIYVWVDALVNYLTGPGLGGVPGDDWERWWAPTARVVHCIGKNVWKFHAVYWPALLLSAGFPVPQEIFVHGFLTAEGRKIGKSLGNAIDPRAVAREVGVDALRWALLRGVPAAADGDFALARVRALYTDELAHGIGNVVRRVASLAQRAGVAAGSLPDAPAAPEGYIAAFEGYAFDEAAGALRAPVDAVNRAIEATRPWELLRRGERAAAAGLVQRWVLELWPVAWWLEPLLPSAAGRVRDALRQLRGDGPALFPALADSASAK